MRNEAGLHRPHRARHSSSAESWRKISAQGSSKSRNDVRFTVRWPRRSTSVHPKRSATELTTSGNRRSAGSRGHIHWARLHSSSCQSISRRRWRRLFQRPSLLRKSAELTFICSRSFRLVGLRSSMPERTPDWAARVASKRDWSRLEDSIHAAERARIHVRTVAYRGDATKIIASYAQLTKARLLVIGKYYGTSRWRRNTRIVSTLSRAASAPVLVLPPQPRAKKNKSVSFAHSFRLSTLRSRPQWPCERYST